MRLSRRIWDIECQEELLSIYGLETVFLFVDHKDLSDYETESLAHDSFENHSHNLQLKFSFHTNRRVSITSYPEFQPKF